MRWMRFTVYGGQYISRAIDAGRVEEPSTRSNRAYGARTRSAAIDR